MSSILTNQGALVALQTLKATNTNLNKAQNEIATGLRVATAKDNSSSWSIASTMSSDINSLKTLSNSLTSANAMVGTARSAAEGIGDIVKQIQERVVQAQNPDADKAKLHAEIGQLADTITSMANSAQYNGINLVNAAGGGAADQTLTVSINRSAGGAVTPTTMVVASVDLTAVATALKALTADADPATGIGGAAALGIVNTQLDTVNSAAAAFGAVQARVEAQSNFVSAQVDALKLGVSALVDANMEEASARLQALQTQQQLGVQALSIANQAPQSILALFR